MNVTVGDSEQYAVQPALWVRGTKPAYRDRNVSPRGFVLPAGGSYDFSTYYGGLSLRKWCLYTYAKDYEFHVRVKGRGTLTLMKLDPYSFRPEELAGRESLIIDSPNRFMDYVVRLGEVRHNIHGVVPAIVGVRFDVTTENDMVVSSASWHATVDDARLRDVKIAVCTTTFKKEHYITANIERVRRDILYKTCESDYDEVADEPWFDEVSRHFLMNVIDNGQTLDATALTGAGITVFPNQNAGGAGGFARGMLEARKQPDVTHVLLMDDDVVFNTESFVRTYNILRIVRDEYANAFLGGAMMSIIEPEVMSEDVGFMNYGGYCATLKPTLKMNTAHDIVTNETFVPPLYRPECQDLRQNYQAWWYCCIPMTEVEKRGMPMPIFVRFDDVEYSLRDGRDGMRKFITMNGINVWHEPFFSRYDSAVERYQTTRNVLVIRSTSNAAKESDFNGMIANAFNLEMKRFNYDDAELIIEGVEDYLKGPDTVFAPGFAERRFKETHKTAERKRSFDDARDDLKALGIDIDEIEPSDVLVDHGRTRFQRLYDYLSFNSQRDRRRDDNPKNPKVAIMELNGGAYQPGSIRDADIIVAVDIPRRLVAIRRRNPERFAQLMGRWDAVQKDLKAHAPELEKQYRVAALRMRTVKAWEEYLGLGK